MTAGWLQLLPVRTRHGETGPNVRWLRRNLTSSLPYETSFPKLLIPVAYTLMEFTSAQIDRIKKLATMLTPVSDIAVLMDVDERRLREIISDKSHPASIAYRKGKAERALQIRQNELELAEAGSPLAVQLVGSYIRDMDSDEDL